MLFLGPDYPNIHVFYEMRVKQSHMCCERLVLLTVRGIYRCDHLFLEEKPGKSGQISDTMLR